MSQAAVTARSGWMLASISGSGVSSSARTVRIAGPYVSITIAIPSSPRAPYARTMSSTSARLRAGRMNSTSATSASRAATDRAYSAWCSVMPGSISS